MRCRNYHEALSEELSDTLNELLRSSVAVSCARPIAAVSRWHLIATLQVCEALVVAASCYIWLSDIGLEGGHYVTEFATCGLTVSFAVHFVLRALGAYDFVGVLNVARSCATAAFAWMLATSALLSWAIKLGTQGHLWQISLFGWLAGGILIVLVRFAVAQTGSALLRARWLNHNVAIIGGGAEAQECAQLLRSDRGGANLVGFVSLEGNPSAASGASRPQDPIAELRGLIEQYHVRDVIVATQKHERVFLTELVHGLLGLPVRVLLWPRSCGAEAEWFTRSEYRIGGIPLLLASAPPLDGWRWVLKDSRDRLLAFFLLICISPVLLGIAVAIRLSSPGSILFRQEREGYNGRAFTIFKFRTMRVAESPVGELVLTARRDPRVFPLGALLRKTSLDELPQIFNVLRGDMWLVGPRPHSPLATAAGKRYAVAVQEYMSRFRVKPGITGWAQVNGWRGPTNTIEQIQQRVAYDRYYIENISFWLDLKILLKTSVKGFKHYNAF